MRGDAAAAGELEAVLQGPLADLAGLAGVGRLAGLGRTGAALDPTAGTPRGLDDTRRGFPATARRWRPRGRSRSSRRPGRTGRWKRPASWCRPDRRRAVPIPSAPSGCSPLDAVARDIRAHPLVCDGTVANNHAKSEKPAGRAESEQDPGAKLNVAGGSNSPHRTRTSLTLHRIGSSGKQKRVVGSRQRKPAGPSAERSTRPEGVTPGWIARVRGVERQQDDGRSVRRETNRAAARRRKQMPGRGAGICTIRHESKGCSSGETESGRRGPGQANGRLDGGDGKRDGTKRLREAQRQEAGAGGAGERLGGRTAGETAEEAPGRAGGPGKAQREVAGRRPERDSEKGREAGERQVRAKRQAETPVRGRETWRDTGETAETGRWWGEGRGQESKGAGGETSTAGSNEEAGRGGREGGKGEAAGERQGGRDGGGKPGQDETTGCEEKSGGREGRGQGPRQKATARKRERRSGPTAGEANGQMSSGDAESRGRHLREPAARTGGENPGGGNWRRDPAV